jgi:flagellar M-ring protein FliF
MEVVNLRFAEAPSALPITEPTGLLGILSFTKDDVMNLIEMVVVLLLGLVVLFMVVRPLVKRILSPDPNASLAPAPIAALPDASAQAPGQNLIPGGNATSQMIDVAQVQGQVHAQSVHRVGELADRNPSETASIIRQWLSEPA